MSALSRILMLAAVFLVLAAAAAWAHRWYRGQESDWETRAQTTLDEFAARKEAEADSLRAIAESFQQKSEALEDSAVERVRIVERRITEVREIPVPDTCAAVVAPRDSIIDELHAQTGRLRASLELQRTATEMVEISAGRLRVRGDSLVAVLEDRPGPRPWWLPRAGFGVLAGVCQAGPCIGVGVTLSWSL